MVPHNPGEELFIIYEISWHGKVLPVVSVSKLLFHHSPKCFFDGQLIILLVVLLIGFLIYGDLTNTVLLPRGEKKIHYYPQLLTPLIFLFGKHLSFIVQLMRRFLQEAFLIPLDCEDLFYVLNNLLNNCMVTVVTLYHDE